MYHPPPPNPFHHHHHDSYANYAPGYPFNYFGGYPQNQHIHGRGQRPWRGHGWPNTRGSRHRHSESKTWSKPAEDVKERSSRNANLSTSNLNTVVDDQAKIDSVSQKGKSMPDKAASGPSNNRKNVTKKIPFAPPISPPDLFLEAGADGIIRHSSGVTFEPQFESNLVQSVSVHSLEHDVIVEIVELILNGIIKKIKKVVVNRPKNSLCMNLLFC